MKTIDCRGC